jgi:AraC-like DNA-binding protein
MCTARAAYCQTCRSSCSPVRIQRTRELLSDGDDNLVFSWTKQARVGQYRKKDFSAGAGEATLVSACEEATAIYPVAFDNAVISVPRAALAPLLRDADAILSRPIPADTPGLHLLLRYLDVIYDEGTLPTATLRQAVVTHVYDLLGVMFGATRDAAELAKARGVGAARLHLLKTYVRENMVNSRLSVSEVAAQHRLTSRYVQMLFEENGTTFTEFLREERLAHAYRILSSPRYRDRKILDIALTCGFGDLSHFNRAFRARYHATPSEIRAYAATRP